MSPGTELEQFTALSEILTGEKKVDKTLAGQYLSRLKTQYPTQMGALLNIFGGCAGDKYPLFEVRRRIVDDKTLGPLAQQIIAIWYTAEFVGPDGKTANPGTQAQFYRGFLWHVIKAHPPTHSTLKYGYWTKPPKK
jgi:hypothetical protein